uniref:Uncharacterized protein n=1 Tax=Chloropicon laureae TaxID=464258 RepID=A0A7S3E0M7_9CHLO
MAEVGEKLKRSEGGEGFAMSYHRFPWSRERSPTPKDIQKLHALVSRAYADQKAAGGGGGGGLRFFFLSHTGIGMGVRNIPVMVACYHVIRSGAHRQLDRDLPLPGGAEEEEEDNRDILSLTRVLREGPKCLRIVQRCIAYFSPIGDMRRDYQRCREEFQNHQGIATKLLGLGYLQRYFYCICWAAFLLETANGEEEVADFTEWFASRAELSHLLENLRL